MPTPDLNLLVTLDMLLAEGSVAGAARKLRLSASAMSRALSRLRETVGDPLLVRHGRGLVPTPRALELREHVRTVVSDARAVLRPSTPLDPRRLTRAFTLRTTEGFAETFGLALVERTRREAPKVRLRFVPKADKDDRLLRDGVVDLETGVVDGETGPELRTRALFRDRYVVVVRAGHPLSKGRPSAARYAVGEHVVFSRPSSGPPPKAGPVPEIDEALASLGLERDVVVVVGGFTTAIALARSSDLIATVPARHTAGLRDGMVTFPLPFEVREFTVSMLWHLRLDADPAHRWLRGCLREVTEPSAPGRKARGR